MSQLHRHSWKRGLRKSRTLRKVSSRKVSINSKDFLELVYSPPHTHARNSPLPSLKSSGKYNIPLLEPSPVIRKPRRTVTLFALPERRERASHDKKFQKYSKKSSKGIKNDQSNGKCYINTYDDMTAETKYNFNQSESSSKQVNSYPEWKFGFNKGVTHKRSMVKIHTVPPINLQSPSSIGFHQEFMKKAHEFSLSWRNALREGR